MNYSRNIKKSSMGKRIITSWLVIALVFSLIGGLIGAAIAKGTAKEPETIVQTEVQREVLIYGKADGKIFEAEMPIEWAAGSDFVPLNVPMDSELQEFVYYLSAGYDIDFTFAMALIQHESGFKAGIISKTNDYGLMQINQMNHEYLAEQLHITDFLEPYSNIRAGMFVLRKLFEKYETPEKVLMAYNMGETGASRLWAQGVFETNYSRKIMGIQAEFAAEIERSSSND